MSKHLSTIQSEEELLEKKFLERIISICGKESFRPKLNHIKSFLADDRRLLESKAKVIIIGGTNGKGETSHCLNHLFNESGFKNCMWTSPHVNSITERFRYCDSNINIRTLIELLDQNEKDIIELGLSFYEALFVLFIKYSTTLDIDFLILEVGLGGRFDATNIFTKPIAAITSIGLDHTQILGTTLKEILFEKYGITRLNGKLFENIEQRYLKNILQDWCDRDSLKCVSVSDESVDNFQARNREMAIALFEEATDIKDYQFKGHWPTTFGRGDKINSGEYEFLFYGAHNLMGHQKLLSALNNNDTQYDVLISFSSGREDQISNIIKLYESYPCIIKSINILEFSHDRALSAFEIKKALGSETKVYEIHNFLDTILGINEEIKTTRYSASSTTDMPKTIELKTRNVLVVGSYYFIANMQNILSYKPIS